jgi:phosphoglycolate phosphatase-like HAD superfamily hydrolase
MSHLVLFDIDGTLTLTNDVDSQCYVHAMSEYLSTTIDDDWSSYRHVTDSGIAAELFQRHDRPLSDISFVRQRFISLLTDALRTDPGCCRQVAGAADFLRDVRDKPDTVLGLATGGWAESAHAKLQHACLDVADLAIASADDSHSRSEIMKICLQRAADLAKVDKFATVTYFGDGVWDATASAELGWNFIGIAAGQDAVRLQTVGADQIFADFSDRDSILRALRLA